MPVPIPATKACHQHELHLVRPARLDRRNGAADESDIGMVGNGREHDLIVTIKRVLIHGLRRFKFQQKLAALVLRLAQSRHLRLLLGDRAAVILLALLGSGQLFGSQSAVRQRGALHGERLAGQCNLRIQLPHLGVLRTIGCAQLGELGYPAC